MRFFVAIPLSEELKKKLKELQNTLPSDIRAQTPDQMHLTLRFLGETSAAKAETLKAQLKTIRSPAFELAIKGIGTFPANGKPKVIWAGVEKDALLMKLQKSIEKICVNTGFKPERRAFTPHITMGRIKGASSQTVQKWMKQHNDWKSEKLYVDSFILFESHHKAGGIIHKVVKKYLI